MRQKKIDSNIKNAFKVIDDYLPVNYTKLVMEIVPDAKPENIRSIRKRRTGNIEIIAALKKVAIRNKELLK